MERITTDYIEANHYYERYTKLRISSIEFQDSLMNPLDMPTDSLEYLKVESSAPRSSIDPFGTYYQHVLMVDAYTLEEKRIRYNFWLALSDVGGFRDGLYIILSAIIGPIVAILYENDLLKDHLRSQTLSAT